MPSILLTLASEEVRGEAFLPERQVPGNYFRPVFSTARKTDNRQLTVAAVNHWFKWEISLCRKSQLDIVPYPESLLCVAQVLAFVQST